MPYDIVKDGNQHCLVKKDTGQRVPGGCHPTEEEAKRHMRAILASEHMNVVISITEMRAICPKCAETMEARGLKEMRFDEFQGHEYHTDKMRRCLDHLLEKGFDEGSAHAICYAVLGGEANMSSWSPGEFVLDEFVTVRPGQPYRLLRAGKIVKDGKERIITPEMLKSFRLPHFKPPIKAGSHNDDTPAGGHIVGLEVREDGLYAIPELNDRGQLAFSEGQFRYHSPEIMWDGGLENPETGEMISGPLIVGDALLHTPHLGEAAALYTYQPFTMEETMSDTVQVPTSLWDKILAALNIGQSEATPPEPPPEPEIPAEMRAAVAERDALKAKLEEIDKQTALRARVEKFQAELKEVKAPAEAAEKLAAMTDEQAVWVIEQILALSAQIKTGDLLGEIGSAGSGADNPQIALHAAITAVMAAKNVDYNAAFAAVRAEHPELIQAAY